MGNQSIINIAGIQIDTDPKQSTKTLEAGDIVAVYGTLRKGNGNHKAFGLGREDYAEFLGEAQVPGRLYSLGLFPGYRPPVTGVLRLSVPSRKDVSYVTVELYRLKEAHIGTSLDGLEGFDPDGSPASNNFYQRAEFTIFTQEGETLTAHIYVYQEQYYDRVQLIENGDWNKFRGI